MIFVTASDTGVGKTLLTCLGLRSLRNRNQRPVGLKPCMMDQGLVENPELVRENTEHLGLIVQNQVSQMEGLPER